MFDHLIHRPSSKRVLKMHHHLSVGVLVIGVISAVIALNVNLYTKGWYPKTSAQQPVFTMRFVEPATDRREVAPLTFWPLAILELETPHNSAALDRLDFTLNGTYKTNMMAGMSLTLDGIQAGLPQTPPFGRVSFPLNNVVVGPGRHRLAITLTTNPGSSIATFEIADPKLFLHTIAGDQELVVHTVWPDASGRLTVVAQGSVGAFARRDTLSAPTWTNVYLYGDGEDFRLKRLDFVANEDIPGARLDFFIENRFIGTAPFVGSKARIDFMDTTIRILRDKNTKFRVLLAEVPQGAQPLIQLTGVHAEGFKSHIGFRSRPHLDLW